MNPSFENTIEALDRTGALLTKVEKFSVIFREQIPAMN